MDTFETTNGERREDPAIRQQEIWADLAARLQQLSAEQRSGPNDRDPVPPATASSTASSGPDLPQADPVDPSTLAMLVGEEVASVLQAAQVAASQIRSKARAVAGEMQREIDQFQRTLARLAVQMDELVMRIEPGASVAPSSGPSIAHDASPDRDVLIEDGDEDEERGRLHRLRELSLQRPLNGS